MTVPFYYCYYLSIFLILSHVHSQTQLQDQEHAVLMNIKRHLKNPSFLSHWTTSNTASHCTWPEITCTSDYSVTGLTLVNGNITQTLPPFMCDLKNLTLVNFSRNFIPGEFPTFLYKCSKLVYLDLEMNDFSGTIPDDIDNLVNLQHLNLGSTSFSGDIPASIGRLKELKLLQLHYCLFNGTFPYERPFARKSVIVCRVIAGRIYSPLEEIEEERADSEFDSLSENTNGHSDAEELYVLNPKALLPCFVVIYKHQTDKVRRILGGSAQA